MSKQTQIFQLTINVPEYNATINTHLRLPVLVGRSDPQVNYEPDVDLAPYDAVDMGVSRRHLLLIPDKHAYMVKDLNSTNGSFLNEVQLKPHKIYPLNPNDELRLGDLRIQVQFETQPYTAELKKMQTALLESTLNARSTANPANASVTAIPTSEHKQIKPLIDAAQVTSTSEVAKITPNPGSDKASTQSKRPAELAKPTIRSLSVEVHEAIKILRKVTINKDISEGMLQYIAKRATEHPRWKVAQRLAVLETACGFGYVSRENAELLQEQRRINKLKFNGIREQ